MTHAVYRRCAETVHEAQQVLVFLQHRESVTDTVISRLRRRRRTADIALQAVFEELQDAFITPIDREDMLRLCQLSEHLLSGAEEVLIALRRYRLAALPTEDTVLLAAISEEYRLLHEVFAALPTYPHNPEVLRRLVAAERQHRLTAEISGSSVGNELLLPLSALCRRTGEEIRYLLLKSA